MKAGAGLEAEPKLEEREELHEALQQADRVGAATDIGDILWGRGALEPGVAQLIIGETSYLIAFKSSLLIFCKSYHCRYH